MQVAITGSAGFIGSNLVEACLKKGWDVTAIDNFSTGIREMADPERVRHLHGNYVFYDQDINDTARMKDVFQGCDVVFHLAALPRVSFSIDHPLEADYANVHGTLSVLEAARGVGARRVVFSCSSSVYGGVSEFPTPETAPPSPKSPYALHKQAGAEYCRLYSELHGLDTCSLLYFNVLGKYQRADSAYATVVPAFFHAAMNDEPCRIDGTGLQSRDFCHVDNVVQANILAAEYEDDLNGERFNIACGNTHSVNDVLTQVRALIKRPINSIQAEARLGDPDKSHGDISKAKKILGYDPKIKFKESMKLTAQWWLNGCPSVG